MSTNGHAVALRKLAEAWSLRGGEASYRNIEHEAADEIDRLEALLAERDKQINAQASTICLQSKQIEERNRMVHDCANKCASKRNPNDCTVKELAEAVAIAEKVDRRRLNVRVLSNGLAGLFWYDHTILPWLSTNVIVAAILAYAESQKPQTMVTNEEAQAAMKRVAMAGASEDMETLKRYFEQQEQ